MAKEINNGDWVRITAGNCTNKIGQVIGHTDHEARVYAPGQFAAWVSIKNLDILPNYADTLPVAEIKFDLNKLEVEKLFADHDKYCPTSNCDKCYCSLGTSPNPKFDELCLYNLIKKL